MNWEALTIGTQFNGEGWSTVGFMSANPAEGSHANLLSPELSELGAFLAPTFYDSVGPVYQVGFDGLDGFEAALGDDDIQDIVGAFAMRMMKRGRGLYGRFHDYNLSDRMLEVALGRVPRKRAAGREGFEPSDAL